MHAERRKRFLERMGPGAVAIVQGASLVTRSNDTEFPFRQDSDFHYLTGFDHPNAAALRRASAAHGEHEKRTGQHDANWADWYAEYIVREQAGKQLPS